MSRYRPVDAAIKRRLDAGLCPICGGAMVKPKLLRELPARCVNSQDGRHGGGPGRKIRLK